MAEKCLSSYKLLFVIPISSSLAHYRKELLAKIITFLDFKRAGFIPFIIRFPPQISPGHRIIFHRKNADHVLMRKCIAVEKSIIFFLISR